MGLRFLSDAEVRSRSPEIWDVYVEVFGDRTSYDEWLDGMLLRHAAREKFRFAAALEGSALVGFAWGYRGAPGQYYTDSVRDALGDELADQWQPACEIVELAVLPGHRRGGLGRSLLHMMTQGIAGPARVMLGRRRAISPEPFAIFLRRYGSFPRLWGATDLVVSGPGGGR